MKRPLQWLGLALAVFALAPDGDPESAIGQSFRIPYHVTMTNHYLIRARINGKGPFNFLVDTGAPALFIGTDVAKKIGLTPAKNDFWTKVERFDLEGGATLTNVKARIDDPYQLVGMNALGLPGATIDGIMGYTILARFRMEFDPTSDRLVFTRLDFTPKEPVIPQKAANEAPPVELQMMNALGPAMKLIALFTGKQPEDQLQPQGLLGIELAAADGAVRVTHVLGGSPAALAKIQPGDRLILLGGKSVNSVAAAHAAIAGARPRDQIKLTIERGGDQQELTLTATEGF